MKKEKNVFLGLIFVIAALLILFNGLHIFSGLHLWKIFVTVLLVTWLKDGVKRKDWGSMIFPIVILFILYKDILGLDNIGTGTVFVAAIFASIGLGFLFGNSSKPGKGYGGEGYDSYIEIKEEAERRPNSDNEFMYSTSMSSGTKYVKADNFVQGTVNCAFGDVKVYFDDAQIHCDEAIIYVNNKFGNISLYMPKEWYVTNDTKIMFGGVEEKNRSITNGAPKVRIVGSVCFGSVSVTYI